MGKTRGGFIFSKRMQIVVPGPCFDPFWFRVNKGFNEGFNKGLGFRI